MAVATAAESGHKARRKAEKDRSPLQGAPGSLGRGAHISLEDTVFLRPEAEGSCFPVAGSWSHSGISILHPSRSVWPFPSWVSSSGPQPHAQAPPVGLLQEESPWAPWGAPSASPTTRLRMGLWPQLWLFPCKLWCWTKQGGAPVTKTKVEGKLLFFLPTYHLGADSWSLYDIFTMSWCLSARTMLTALVWSQWFCRCLAWRLWPLSSFLWAERVSSVSWEKLCLSCLLGQIKSPLCKSETLGSQSWVGCCRWASPHQHPGQRVPELQPEHGPAAELWSSGALSVRRFFLVLGWNLNPLVTFISGFCFTSGPKNTFNPKGVLYIDDCCKNILSQCFCLAIKSSSQLLCLLCLWGSHVDWLRGTGMVPGAPEHSQGSM